MMWKRWESEMIVRKAETDMDKDIDGSQTVMPSEGNERTQYDFFHVSVRLGLLCGDLCTKGCML